MQVNGYFLPLKYSCCNLLQNCKDTLFTPAFGLFGTAFQEHCKTFVFPPLYILLVFKVEIKYIEATFAALIKGGCKFAVFLSLRFFYIRFARFVIVFRVPQITREGVQLYIKAVQSFPSPLLPLMLAAVYYLLSLCLLLRFVLN